MCELTEERIKDIGKLSNWFIRKYLISCNTRFDRDDLYQTAFLAGVMAARTYDPNKYAHFSTFAIWAMLHDVNKFIRLNLPLKVPQRHFDEADREERARMRRLVVSGKKDEAEDSMLKFEDAATETPFENVSRQERESYCKMLLEALPVAERDLLERYFGFGEHLGCESLGEACPGKSRQRAHQIYVRAIGRLRKIIKLRELEDVKFSS